MADFVAASGNWAKARKMAMGAFIGLDGAIRYKPGEAIFEARPVVMVDKAARSASTELSHSLSLIRGHLLDCGAQAICNKSEIIGGDLHL